MRFSEAIRQAYTTRGMRPIQGDYFDGKNGCCVIGALLIAQHGSADAARAWYAAQLPHIVTTGQTLDVVAARLAEGPFEVALPTEFAGVRYFVAERLVGALLCANDVSEMPWTAMVAELERTGN